MQPKYFLLCFIFSLFISPEFPVLSELAQVRRNLSIIKQVYLFYLIINPKVLFLMLLNKPYVLALPIFLNA